jgi:hypothetical protein
MIITKIKLNCYQIGAVIRKGGREEEGKRKGRGREEEGKRKGRGREEKGKRKEEEVEGKRKGRGRKRKEEEARRSLSLLLIVLVLSLLLSIKLINTLITTCLKQLDIISKHGDDYEHHQQEHERLYEYHHLPIFDWVAIKDCHIQLRWITS